MAKGHFHRKRKKAPECRMISCTGDIELTSDHFPEMTSVPEPTESGIANVALPLTGGSFVDEITALLSQSFNHNDFPDLFPEFIKELALSEETLQLDYYEYLKQHYAFLKGMTGDGKRTIMPPEELRAILLSKMEVEEDLESVHPHSLPDNVNNPFEKDADPGFTLKKYLANGVSVEMVLTCRFARSVYRDFLIFQNALLLEELAQTHSSSNKLAKLLFSRISRYIKKKAHKLALLFKDLASLPRGPEVNILKPLMISSVKVTPNDGKDSDSYSYTQLFQKLTTFITLTFSNKSLWIKTNMSYYYLLKVQSLQ
ncbi:hypothetical protein [Chitinophaga filiformis]|uniref:Uncharacterized protein n=1 Tax=Chitinophaga filiformis TaxID=104663 RepID=A0A1G7MJJ3_CHIFI|nr:hypothetical protein [Chitinophaga filiformis]SDF62058.1 hypothetical protein SAMN04488121_102466 [Chitinophaga filiformis]